MSRLRNALECGRVAFGLGIVAMVAATAWEWRNDLWSIAPVFNPCGEGSQYEHVLFSDVYQGANLEWGRCWPSDHPRILEHVQQLRQDRTERRQLYLQSLPNQNIYEDWWKWRSAFDGWLARCAQLLFDNLVVCTPLFVLLITLIATMAHWAWNAPSPPLDNSWRTLDDSALMQVFRAVDSIEVVKAIAASSKRFRALCLRDPVTSLRLYCAVLSRRELTAVGWLPIDVFSMNEVLHYNVTDFRPCLLESKSLRISCQLYPLGDDPHLCQLVRERIRMWERTDPTYRLVKRAMLMSSFASHFAGHIVLQQK